MGEPRTQQALRKGPVPLTNAPIPRPEVWMGDQKCLGPDQTLRPNHPPGTVDLSLSAELRLGSGGRHRSRPS